MDMDSMDTMMGGHGGMHGNTTMAPGGGGHMDHSMKMYFHTDLHFYVLFKPWMIHNAKHLAGACVGTFIVAMLYEGLKVGRELLHKKMMLKVSPTQHNGQANDAYPVTSFSKGQGEVPGYGSTTSTKPLGPSFGRQSTVSRIFNASHIIQSLLHIVQVFLSMCLMLIFMTYNVYVCVALLLGAGAGYFAFAWLRNGPADGDQNEHCN